jgi:Fe-S-cluster containining protein
VYGEVSEVGVSVFSCLEAGCRDCCIDTRMPLSIHDIRRLRGLGYPLADFMVMVGGERRLRNVEGQCFFLCDAGCRVYDVRPLGCRFYPLVVDGGGRVMVDSDCRHSDRFMVGSEDTRGLRVFAKKLRRERYREVV